MKSVGFKEWSVVCEALAHGRQSVIVRKGGIAEGLAGFSFQHPEFFLFPTWFHEQLVSVRTTDIVPPEQVAGEIEVRCFARVDVVRTLTSWATAERLERFHILQPQVVKERFEYKDAPGVHVAFVRAFRLSPAWRLAEEKRYGGCRSWIELPELPSRMEMVAVLSDEEHARRRAEFLAVVGEDVGVMK